MSVHPRKSRVVVLLECCGTREELPRPLNAQEGQQPDYCDTYAVHTPPREGEEDGRVITRVSRSCWPCLRVVFLTNATHKKSQQMYILADLRRVRPPPFPSPSPDHSEKPSIGEETEGRACAPA